jgi:flagellar biogenesis protein FliO
MPLAHRQDVHLLRVGGKLILVSVSAAGAETLTEITDPQDVDRLAGLCKQTSSQSASSTFRNLLDQFSQQERAPDPVAVRSNPRDVRPGAGPLKMGT